MAPDSAAPDDTLVLGLDVGGTTTRALVTTVDGRRVSAGRGGGGNPTAHGASAAAAAVAQALDGVAPDRVRAGVIGLAGAGRLRDDPPTAEAFARMWADVGLAGRVRPVSDVVVAFAAGTPVPDGSVLLAGTGAVAAAVRGRRLTHVADGNGWLLGDHGSGVWLGREAVRHLLALLDGRRPLTDLGTRVLVALTGSERVDGADPRLTVDAVVGAVHGRPPVELARLAPVVLGAAAEGDAAAAAIVERAAAELLDTLAVVREPAETGPVVLAGGLLTADTPLAAAVRDGLARRWPDAVPAAARDGAAAAAWIAALDLRAAPGATPADALHAVLVAPAPAPARQ